MQFDKYLETYLYDVWAPHYSANDECYFLGEPCNTIDIYRSLTNMLPPSSGQKSKPNNEEAKNCNQLAWITLALMVEVLPRSKSV
jgi:hypothetical protein